ncbi:MAG: hypothetical protein M8835_00145 [marine benthic group bacterium]|nr:hypothetical protein [Gemmatimonadota bacterium]
MRLISRAGAALTRGYPMLSQSRRLSTLTSSYLLLVLGCSGGEPHSRNAIELVGVNDPVVDVPALQDAVNQYAEVVLEGVFALGDSARIVITRSVEISGNGANLRGGYESITIRNPEGGRVLLEDLSIEGASGTAILYLEGDDLEIRRVRILDVVPGRVYRQVPASVLPQEVTGRIGFVAWDWDADTEAPGGRIQGRIVVRDCQFDLRRPESPYSRAIVTAGGSADVEISDSVIRDEGGPNAVGVEVFVGNRTVTLERNEIIAGLLPAGVFGSRGPVFVRDNSLRTTAANEGRGAVLMLATHADSAGEVVGNEIRIEGATAGIVTGFDAGNPLVTGPIRIPYRNGSIRSNTISGTLAAPEGEGGGIVLGYESRGNLLEGNDLGGLTTVDGQAPAPSVRLGPTTGGNVVELLSPDEIVRDEGDDNRISG